MGNIIISIAVIFVSMVIATYGSYTGYYALQRSTYVMRVGSSIEREIGYVNTVGEDLGRLPLVGDLDVSRIATLNAHGVSYSYGTSGVVGYVCAQSEARDYVVEAFQKVAASRPGAMVGQQCNAGGGASATAVALTVRIF